MNDSLALRDSSHSFNKQVLSTRVDELRATAVKDYVYAKYTRACFGWEMLPI